MWRLIIYVWAIACISATNVEREKLSTIDLKNILPTINFAGFVVDGLSKNTTEVQSQYEKASLIYLKKLVVDNLHYPSEVCHSPYEVACDWGSVRPSEWDLVRGRMNQQLLLLKSELKDLLVKPVLPTDKKSLIIEKQLYQDCLSSRTKSTIKKSQSITDYALHHIIDNVTDKSWQEIDMSLKSMGFGYTFFNIDVVDDNSKKTLLLQPPPIIELVDNYESLLRAMKILKFHSNHKKEIQLAMHFFAALNKTIPKDSTYHLMRVPEWYEYNLQGNDQGSQSSEIDWHQLFDSVTKDHNVHAEYLVVKDREYFQDLERLLRIFSKTVDHKASFVAIKWLINNLYFLNWEAYSQLHDQEKNSLCLQQLKLYGASQVLVRSIEKETDIKYFLETAKEVLLRIAKTIDIDIFISQKLKEHEKRTLTSYLYDITAPILQNEKYSSFVDDFYGDFKVTHNYLKDIIAYRKNVNKIEENYGTPEKLPLNVNDLSQPQNRLLLKAYLRMGLLVSPYLHKEFHYGVYGTEMARFIYDLIIRKKLDLKEKHDNDVEWLYTSVEYPEQTKSCLLGKVVHYEIDQPLNL